MATCFAQGTSFAQLGLEHQGSATLEGFDAATLIAALNIGSSSVQFSGDSSAQLQVQEPFQGYSSAVLFGEVYPKPTPVREEFLDKAKVLYGKPLRDITLLRDQQPYVVRYSLMSRDRGGVYRPIGVPMRTPASDGPGKFFLPGVAGEGGQPGEWCVTWYYQDSFYGPVQQQQQEFLVLEHVCLDRQVSRRAGF